jgi:hypothetical protein
VTNTVRTPFEAFLAALRREPTAAECEQWAAQNAGGPEEPRALIHAGWLAARGGEGERGLELFRRTAGFGGEYGRDAQVGIVEQLYELGRDEEADAAQRALRAELDDQPGGSADLRGGRTVTRPTSRPARTTASGASRRAPSRCRCGRLPAMTRAGATQDVSKYKRSCGAPARD